MFANQENLIFSFFSHILLFSKSLLQSTSAKPPYFRIVILSSTLEPLFPQTKASINCPIYLEINCHIFLGKSTHWRKNLFGTRSKTPKRVNIAHFALFSLNIICIQHNSLKASEQPLIIQEQSCQKPRKRKRNWNNFISRCLRQLHSQARRNTVLYSHCLRNKNSATLITWNMLFF